MICYILKLFRPHVMTSFHEEQTLSATESEGSDLEQSRLQPDKHR
jgi:hypothetical protein